MTDQIKYIDTPRQLDPYKGWDEVKDFPGKDTYVQNEGRRYKLVTQRVKALSKMERIGRGLLGIALVIITLGSALFSQTVRELLTLSEKRVTLGVLQPKKRRCLPQLKQPQAERPKARLVKTPTLKLPKKPAARSTREPTAAPMPVTKSALAPQPLGRTSSRERLHGVTKNRPTMKGKRRRPKSRPPLNRSSRMRSQAMTKLCS